MEKIGRHGNWLLGEVAFLWTLLPSWHKWKQNRCCVHCHRQKSCTSVPRGGRNGRGSVFVCVWNGRVVWARRAPAGSTTSAPSCCLLSSMGAPGEGWTDPQGPRCGGALAWRCLAELGLLCGLSRGTWRAWVWALNWVSWVKSQERLLFKVLTYPPSCHDCLSNVSQVNTTWHCWSSLFLGKKRCFQKNSFLLTKWTRVLPSLC